MGWARRYKIRLVIGSVCLIIAMALWTGVLSRVAQLLPETIGSASDAFLDVGDKLGSIVAALVAVSTVVKPVRAAIPALGTPVRATTDSGPHLVDRADNRAQLHRALRSPRTRVIVVSGDEGVGKTQLVNRVLWESKLRLTVHPHEVTTTYHPSAHTLLRDLDAGGDDSGSWGPPFDESTLGRLEKTLTRYRKQRAIIVLDNAELLLDQDRHVVDLALDEAFQAVATARCHRVKIILVTKVQPRSAGTHEKWLPRKPIKVLGLPFDFFKAIALERPGNAHRMAASLGDDQLRRLWRNLGRQLRLAEIFDAIADTAKGVPASELEQKVHGWVQDDDTVTHIRDRLLDQLLTALNPAGKRVYEALAAFACPADADEITAVVNSVKAEKVDPGDIQDELDRLNRHVVRCVDGRYFLPHEEALRALRCGDDTAPDETARIRWLLLYAADQLKNRRRRLGQAPHIDPVAFFPEVDAHLRAGSYTTAYRTIRAIDRGADTGRPDQRLHERREQVAERIRLDLRPRNYLILGYLSHRAGDLSRAETHFRSVLELGGGIASIEAKARLHLGWISWSRGTVGSAAEAFAQARDLAPQDPVVQASAWQGLARCARRQARFGDAVTAMQMAYDATEELSPQRVSVAGRLARLYLDTQQTDAAQRVVDEARALAERHRDDALRAISLDALADVRFAQGHDDDALTYARQALELALRHHDAFTALQARLTICTVRLRKQQWHRARREATLAERYRDTERSLMVTALRAVALHRMKRRAEARHAFDRVFLNAKLRIEQDPNDAAAWELVGLALCGLSLQPGGPSIDGAVEAFGALRQDGQVPAEGHARYLAFLVSTMAGPRTDRARLQPVLSSLIPDSVLPPVR
ncbi:hypothetical protein Asi03nite_74130 [Actinoplanes siamensis]|uniref:Orc1-like AAA ATPase domain-containing protein n=2 Tax=Actinoplanes siamensis TaxID=1223317 RepID=A0A919NFT0_9ACTN|nr:hypothetical protein Asi03nite_74130 [Actinoplanes siamensis]